MWSDCYMFVFNDNQNDVSAYAIVNKATERERVRNEQHTKRKANR